MLGPNGAGKTTLINIVCGIVNATSGKVTVDGHDIVKDARAARSLIGLVPQELTTDAFETVWDTTTFSRGLFGKPRDPARVEAVLKSLSLWDKKNDKIMTLSGGMKRRVMIAKALAHEPQVLFLDEPTAGVDVELRQDMWNVVRGLRDSGVTIILTTHYIDEAEEMADRIAVINHGEIILVEEKTELMRKLGKKQLTLQLHSAARRASRRRSRAIRSSCTRAASSSPTPTTRKASARESPRLLAALAEAGHPLQGLADDAELARGDLREPRLEEVRRMNWHAVRAIYFFEMARTWRTIGQSILAPVLSTSLYFVVFGSAIGSRIQEVNGTSYGAFIVPGLMMLSLLTESISNASFGIYFPRFVGTIYEVLSAPVSAAEILLGYVGAAASKSVILGFIILATAALFVPLHIAHPFWMLLFLVLTAVDVQPVRLHHRRLGRQLREAADHSAADHHAAHVPRRQLLLHQHAAAALAEDHAVQPGRLPRERLPLELLRDRRRARRDQPRHDGGVHGRLPRDGLVDPHDRLSAEEVEDRNALRALRLTLLRCSARQRPPRPSRRKKPR